MLAACTSSFFWWIPNGTPYDPMAVSLISEALQAMLDKDQSRRKPATSHSEPTRPLMVKSKRRPETVWTT
jgi:hypothetical protein